MKKLLAMLLSVAIAVVGMATTSPSVETILPCTIVRYVRDDITEEKRKARKNTVRRIRHVAVFAATLPMMLFFGAAIGNATAKKPSKKERWLRKVLEDASIDSERIKLVIANGLTISKLSLWDSSFGTKNLEDYGFSGVEANKIFSSYDDFCGHKGAKRHMETFRAKCVSIADMKFGIDIVTELKKLNGAGVEQAVTSIDTITEKIKAAKEVKIDWHHLTTRTFGCSQGSDVLGITPGTTTDKIVYYDLGVETPTIKTSKTKAKKERANVDEAIARLEKAIVDKVTIVGLKGHKKWHFVTSSSSQLKKLKAIAVEAKLWAEKENIFLAGLTIEKINSMGGKLGTKFLQLYSLLFTPSYRSGYRLRQLIFVPESKKTFKNVDAIKVSADEEDNYEYNPRRGIFDVIISLFDGMGVWSIPMSAQIRVGHGKGMLIYLPNLFSYIKRKIHNAWHEEQQFDPNFHVGIVDCTVAKAYDLFGSSEEFYSAYERCGIDEIRILRADDENTHHDVKTACRQLLMSLFDLSEMEIKHLIQTSKHQVEFESSTKGLLAYATGCDDAHECEDGYVFAGERKHRSAEKHLYQQIPELLLDPAVFNNFQQKLAKHINNILAGKLNLLGSCYMFLARDTLAFIQIHGQGMDVNDPNLGGLRGDEVNIHRHGGKIVIANRLPSPFFGWRNCPTVDKDVYNNGCITISVHTLNTEVWQADEDGDKLFIVFCAMLSHVIDRMISKYNIVPVLFDKVTPPATEGENPKHIPEDETERLAWIAKTLFQSWQYNLVGKYSNAATRAWNTLTMNSTSQQIEDVLMYVAAIYAAVTWSVDAMKTGWMPLLPDEDLELFGTKMPYSQRYVKATWQHPADDDEYWDEVTEPLGDSVLDRIVKQLQEVIPEAQYALEDVVKCSPEEYFNLTESESDWDTYSTQIAITKRGIEHAIPDFNDVRNALERPLDHKMIETLSTFGKMDFIYESEARDAEDGARMSSAISNILTKRPELKGKIGFNRMNAEGEEVYNMVDTEAYDIWHKAVNGEPISAYLLAELISSQNAAFVKEASDEDSLKVSQQDMRDHLFMELLKGYAPKESVSEFGNMLSVTRQILGCIRRSLNDIANGSSEDTKRKQMLRKFLYRNLAPYMLYVLDEKRHGRMAQYAGEEDESESIKEEDITNDQVVIEMPEEAKASDEQNDDEVNIDEFVDLDDIDMEEMNEEDFDCDL